MSLTVVQSYLQSSCSKAVKYILDKCYVRKVTKEKEETANKPILLPRKVEFNTNLKVGEGVSS